MKCPKCQLEMYIKGDNTQVENGDTPDLPTKVYTVQTLVCNNPVCPDFDAERDKNGNFLRFENNSLHILKQYTTENRVLIYDESHVEA